MPFKSRKEREGGGLTVLKPCEIKDHDDYNCIVCPVFYECQMTALKEMGTKAELDDDY